MTMETEMTTTTMLFVVIVLQMRTFLTAEGMTVELMVLWGASLSVPLLIKAIQKILDVICDYLYYRKKRAQLIKMINIKLNGEG